MPIAHCTRCIFTQDFCFWVSPWSGRCLIITLTSIYCIFEISCSFETDLKKTTAREPTAACRIDKAVDLLFVFSGMGRMRSSPLVLWAHQVGVEWG
jgi:hypothetical protein